MMALFDAMRGCRRRLKSQSITFSPKYLVPFFLAGLFFLLVYAPDYLTYSDKPEKSDALVWFIGPDSKARREEVKSLLAEGYADYLIIPAYGKIREASTLPSLALAQTINSLLNSYVINPNKYCENTHFEVLEAKRLMEQYGLKTAIFVSSPYHMRRIKIISEKIFNGQSSKIVYIPTRFEIAPHHLLQLTIHDWSNIVSEYVKIIWFLIYNSYSITT
jgi:hypothetical protein